MEETENVKWCVFKVPQYILRLMIKKILTILRFASLDLFKEEKF